jgi:hypothetical protein
VIFSSILGASVSGMGTRAAQAQKGVSENSGRHDPVSYILRTWHLLASLES